MKRFSFGLERVLELRQYAERLAETKLAGKAAVCSSLELALAENARATLRTTAERYRPGSSAADHRAVELYSLRLSSERERLLKSLAYAEAEREEARLVYVDASRERELVGKLREREEEAYYKAVLREETKTMDDLAAGARIRARAEGYAGMSALGTGGAYES
ncbi:MAG: flagellar export protein FliJ [Spirochaetales bacterium]|nr:flagellar export protein FliJ [Spirochaetales bacterium]